MIIALRGVADVEHRQVHQLDDCPSTVAWVVEHGQTLPRSLVRRLACDATAFTRFIVGLGGKVMETSHTKRTLTGHERKIKRIETGGICEAAGCTRPGTIPHHITPYARSRTTSLTDTALFCDTSHTDLHHGKTIRLKNGRSISEHGWVD